MFNRTPRLSDWSDGDLHGVAASHLRLDEGGWFVHRKNWEWAMILRALDHYGYLNATNTALGLGSGHETLMFALANVLRMTVATDLYGKTVFAAREASTSILEDVTSVAPFEFDRRGLLVETMDACDIAFGNESFDVVFSCSSLEHFGPTESILQAQREAYRVLRPGGVYVLSVDYLYHLSEDCSGLARDERGALSDFFTRDEVAEIVVDSAGFRLDEPIDFAVEHEPPLNLLDLETLTAASGDPLPHLYCGFRGSYLTSLFLVLFK
jgi:SAM-dependent methyltransferase